MARPEAPTGLRERKNRRTQESIIRAAAELTLESGYAAATIPRIAERADVAPRTVSTWFPAKDDILFGTIDEQIGRGIEHLRTGSGDLVDRLLAWFADEEPRGRPEAEIVRLRNAATQHDPELRARVRQRTDRVRVAILQTVAEQTGASVDEMGPTLVAGAAMAFIEHLGAISPDLSPEAGEKQVAVGMEFLRAGLASVAAQREAPLTT